MIEVLVADDHPVVRQGLVYALAESPDIRVVDEACNGLEVLERVRHRRFDVVLLDLDMPHLNGLDTLKEITLERPDCRVLIMSGYPEKEYAIRCLQAGALGYVSKEIPPGELLEAIRRVSQNRKYVSGILAELLADRLDADSGKPLHENLSDREFQILCLLGKGKSVHEAADILNLSVSTASAYRAKVLAKLKLETTPQLILYAVEHNLVRSIRSEK